MSLDVSLADILVKVVPKTYRKYVIMISKGKPLLYVQMQNALYDLPSSTTLFHDKLVKYLESYICQINPYNPCVEIKIINNNQMTEDCRVYDLKLSHVITTVIWFVL